MKKLLFPIILLSSFAISTHSQDTIQSRQNVRTGWTFGVLPSVSYDADLGLQYGILTNIYYFGDGGTYPDYLHSFYLEAAYTTMQYGIFRFSYDSKHLITGHRLSVDITYLPDAMCDFYGFNGFESRYNSNWVDDKSTDYRSRAFYKMQRNLFRFAADLQGRIVGHFFWNVGVGVLNYRNGTIDLERLNKNKEAADALPAVATLYDRYVQWGLVKANEAQGGTHPYLHAGATYDTRDRQQNPQSGIHANAFLSYTAAFGDQGEYNNLKINATWHHFLPLWRKTYILKNGSRQQCNVITFAYRVGLQQLLAGGSPYYLNSYLNQLYLQRVLYEGLGGANSLRGIMRNRILGDGFLYGNVELRAQLFRFCVGKENFYIGINPFLDWGMLTQRRKAYTMTKDNKSIPSQTEEQQRGGVDAATLAAITASGERQYDYFVPTPDDGESVEQWHRLHFGTGCGLKITMNDNFVLSIDWARALKEQDNSKSGNLYIKMGYMF